MSKDKTEDIIKEPPKDREELDLEKLVFGDSEGFENNLRQLDNLYDFSDEEVDIEDEEAMSSEEEYGEELGHINNDDLFFIDDGSSNVVVEDGMDVDSEGDLSSSEEGVFSEAAWSDSDDENITVSLNISDRLKKLRKHDEEAKINGKSYNNRLRSQYEKIYPRPKWADQMDDSGSSSDEDLSEEDGPGAGTEALRTLLTHTDNYIMSKQLKLISPNKISITRLIDANKNKKSKSSIQCISFHPSRPLLLTGGFDRTLRIYHIDGKKNQFITSLYLKNAPISSCFFSPLNINKTQSLVFAAGRRRYMSKWDISSGEVEKISRMYGQEEFQRSMEKFKISPSGNFIGLVGSSGWCNILDAKSGQFLRGYKTDGPLADFEFASDESFLITVSTSGTVTEFALGDKVSKSGNDTLKSYTNILRKWQDNSGVGITCVKLGGRKNRWLAIGSNNGIVNIYDRNTYLDGKNPVPLKAIENLVTSISSLQFSHDGQLLSIASRAKRDAFRLVHLPTCSVYSNWPTSGTPLGKVTSVAFSPNNEMIAIGNESGKVTLWRINHY